MGADLPRGNVVAGLALATLLATVLGSSCAAIFWSCETGHRRFNFGRSETRHAGLQQWKAGWGGEVLPLRYARTESGSPPVEGHGVLGAALTGVIRRSPTFVCRALGALLYRYAA